MICSTRDLREILSHRWSCTPSRPAELYSKEHDRVRQIEVRARITKRLLGQELPQAAPNKLLGQHFPIPVGMKVDVKPEEGE